MKCLYTGFLGNAQVDLADTPAASVINTKYIRKSSKKKIDSRTIHTTRISIDVKEINFKTFANIRLSHTIAILKWILKKSTSPIWNCGRNLNIYFVNSATFPIFKGSFSERLTLWKALETLR